MVWRMGKDNTVDGGQSTARGSRIVGNNVRTAHKGPVKNLYVGIVNIKPIARGSLALLLGDLVPEWRVTSFPSLHKMAKSFRSDISSVPTLIILDISRGAEGICNIEHNVFTLTEDIFDIKQNIATLKESTPSVPVVVFSDYDDDRLIYTSLMLGASGVITTPINPQIMVRALVLVAVGGTYIPPGTIARFTEQHQRQN